MYSLSFCALEYLQTNTVISYKPHPRLRSPHRHLVETRHASLDQLLPHDHIARLVWQFVEGLDITPWLNHIKAVHGRPGRNANDPRLMIALWLYATIDGVGS